jgi:rod shape determining protein RodA
MFDRRLLHYFDWGLLGLALLLGCLGLFILYSAVAAETPVPQKILFFKQLIWFSAGVVVMVLSFSFNYKLLDRWGQPFYVFCIVLLVGCSGDGQAYRRGKTMAAIGAGVHSALGAS